MNRAVGFLIAGGAWGALAYGLGARLFGPGLWGGVIASPLIGLSVGGLLQARFEESAGFRRAGVVLISLYLSATLFGLAAGGYDAVLRRTGGAPLERIGEMIVAVWWGVTMTGYLLFLFPLAYLTHTILGLEPGTLTGSRRR